MENERAHQILTQSKKENHDQTCADITVPINDDCRGGEGLHEATIKDEEVLHLSTLE